MERVRPAKKSDLEGLMSLSAKAGRGMTTVPQKAETMLSRITASEKALASRAPFLTEETYFFVLEVDGIIAGMASIFTRLGQSRPFYSYRLSKIVNQAPDIDIKAETNILHLVNDYHGFTEIGTLFVDPDYRGGGKGRLLSFARFMMIAAHPERFDDNVMAEIRGWSDSDQQFPFWDAICAKFFHMGFDEADRRSTYDHRFIADLMPKYPIYVELLSEEAQAIVGKPHDVSKAAMDLLISQGFSYRNLLDLFDGGPSIDTAVSNIQVIKDAKLRKISISEAEGDIKCLIIQPDIEKTSIIQSICHLNSDTISVSEAQLEALNATPTDMLFVSPIHK